MNDFNKALNTFIVRINTDLEAKSREFAEHMKYGEGEYFAPMTFKTGKKNVKMIMNSGSGQSVYCFINIETGQIFKAAGWAAPAKGARGSIYTTDFSKINLSDSGWLYR